MLKYNINAFCMIEEMSGRSVLEMAGNPEQMIKFTVVRLLFWGGLIVENPKISLSDAGKKMNELLTTGGKTFGDIGNMISEAIFASGLVEKSPEAPADGEASANDEAGAEPGNPLKA